MESNDSANLDDRNEIEDLDELLDEEAAGIDQQKLDDIFSQVAPDFESSENVLQGVDFGKIVQPSESGVLAQRFDRLKRGISHLGHFGTSRIQRLILALKNGQPSQKLSLKNPIVLLSGVILAFVFFLVLIGTGALIPSFNNPYDTSLLPKATKVIEYDTSQSTVPLFDSYRSTTFTMTFPKTIFNLKSMSDKPQFGELEFFIDLRDKKYEVMVKSKQSEIMDTIQRVMEQVTWQEIESPMGKDKVKKIIRNRLNQFFERDIVLSVFYRSILLSK